MPTKKGTSSAVKRNIRTAGESKALSTTTIRQTVLLAAAPVEVYDALVNAKKHASFTGAPMSSSNRVNGRFTAWDGYITGRYLELVPGRKIVEEWRTNEWPADYPPSQVELTFTRQDHNTTRLKMVQAAVPTMQAPQYRQGWKDYYWRPLKSYFEAQRREAGKR